MEQNRFFKFLKLDRVMDDVSAYLETRLKLFKIEAREELSEAIARILQAGLIFLLIFLGLVFLSITAGLYLGMLLDNYVLGFLIISGFYILTSIALILFGDKLGLRDKIYKYLGEPFKTKDDE